MKIANKIRVSFLVVVLAFTSITTAVFYVVTKDSFRKSIYNNLSAVCASRSAHIETYLKMLENVVGELSKSVVLENLLHVVDRPDFQQDDAFAIAMKRLKRTKEGAPLVAEFLLLDARGMVVASSSPRSVGQDKSRADFFLAGQKGVYFNDIYYSNDFSEPLMDVAEPFFDSRSDKLLGVIVARVKMNKLNSIVTEKTGLGDTGEIYIVNRAGYLVTPSRFKRVEVLKQVVNTENVKNAHQEGRGEVESVVGQDAGSIYLNYRGVKVLGTHENILHMGWTVVAEIEEREAFRPLARMRDLLLTILCIVPVVAWGLGLWIARRITGSLDQLQDGMEIVGHGNLSYKVGTKTDDEVGQLSRVFDDMVERLKSTMTSVDLLNNEIAEHKKTERALSESEQFLSGVFSSIQDGISVLDKDLRIVRVNAAMEKMFAPFSFVAGRKCFEAYYGKNEPCLNCPAFKTLQTGKSERAIIPKVSSEEHVTGWLELFSFPLIDKDTGEIRGVVESIRDITERKRAEDELKKAYADLKNMQGQLLQSDKMATVGQLAAGVAHEINNPTGFVMANLDVLNGYVQNLKKMLDKYGELERYFTTERNEHAEVLHAELDKLKQDLGVEEILIDFSCLIKESLDGMLRIQRIVADLRSFSHSDESHWEEADITELIQLALNIARNEIKYKAEVVKEYAAVPKILCYPQQLSQVFLNLIVNAVQAITGRGKIIIKTYVDGDMLVVSIADTGCGMSESVRSRIFEPFFTTKPVGKGTGLGLSLAYNIISKHHGEISAASQPGEGTTFTIRLPLKA